MTIDKLYQRCLGLLALIAVLGNAEFGRAGNVLIDPAIRHTNGMPIASSEPHRNSSVNWTCNPDKIGYCGGRYYWPCCDSLRPSRLWAAAHGVYNPAVGCYRTYGGSSYADHERAHGVDGIELPGMTPLGELPNDMLLPGVNPAAPGVPVLPGR